MISNKQMDRVISLIVDYYAPDQILLFGSQAMGSADALSDIDLIIVKDIPLPKGQRGLDLGDCFVNYSLKLDLIFLTRSELELGLRNGSSFVNSIRNNAKIIYEKN